MTARDQAVQRSGTERLIRVELFCIGFTFLVVNYQIYAARAGFIARNPDYVARKPPTISRAISDPEIGPGFAFWIGISAPIVFVGIAALFALLAKQLLASGHAGTPRGRRAILACGLTVMLQGLASTGMVILSVFRFPDHNDMHMVGSYLFFISEAVMVTSMLVAQYMVFRLVGGGVLLPFMARLRWRLVWLTPVGGVIYLLLFVAKDFDLGTWQKPMYTAYVLTEPALISLMLSLSLSFHVDLIAALWRHSRAS
ncbi:hypothetical protein [Shimia biformata]|uniref:hypothetical protein n=1 Tax=Shimia biformata TaxID=1294299 RepID=UPI00194EA263|nr:hypothetical protein [Shimia biformata]